MISGTFIVEIVSSQAQYAFLSGAMPSPAAMAFVFQTDTLQRKG
jgi:hypothetical protein